MSYMSLKLYFSHFSFFPPSLYPSPPPSKMSTDLAGNVQQGEPEVAALLRGRARCYDEEGLLSSHLGNRKRFYHIRSIGGKNNNKNRGGWEARERGKRNPSPSFRIAIAQ